MTTLPITPKKSGSIYAHQRRIETNKFIQGLPSGTPPAVKKVIQRLVVHAKENPENFKITIETVKERFVQLWIKMTKIKFSVSSGRELVEELRDEKFYKSPARQARFAILTQSIQSLIGNSAEIEVNKEILGIDIIDPEGQKLVVDRDREERELEQSLYASMDSKSRQEIQKLLQETRRKFEFKSYSII